MLAGGSGTRLWPFSTDDLPKQLVPLFGGRSLLDIALQRAASVVDANCVWLGAGRKLADALGGVDHIRANRIILEPSGRDTLPAVILGMATIAAHDPDAVVAVLTADHLIEPLSSFVASLEAGFSLAEACEDALVTFGVVPNHPSTGFGYLELGDAIDVDRPGAVGPARVVSTFVEKPNLARAEQLVTAGALWNSGMFVWRAATLLRAAHAFAPRAAAGVAAAMSGDVTAWDGLAKQSVDYGIMEPASTSATFIVAALPLAAAWLDVGSWPAYGDALGRDLAGNATAGRVMLHESSGCTVASSDPDHLVAVVGCEGIVVVHTPSATLVVPAADAQRVKALQALVAASSPDLA